ncbi:MAG: dissimilatory sulfite reductase D family protein [Candidatus Desulforudis sp.]|nr:dissimilatory sulfite reductase D family protein [Desulforudis sp.]
MEELKSAIIEFLEGGKTKTKFYFKDIEKAVKQKIPEAKTLQIKKACSALINDGTLIYFSTGSTTMYGLKGRGITEDH